jgi:hypothetical protein
VHNVVRRRGSHIFQTIGSQIAVRLSDLRTGRPLTPRKIPGTHFCYRLSQTHGHSAAGRVRKVEKNSEIRNLDPAVCNIVPQPTTLLRLSLCLIHYTLCNESNRIWGSGGIAPPFLTLAIDGGEWSASRLCR